MTGFSNDVQSSPVTKFVAAGAGTGTLTFKSGGAGNLTATQDAWLKFVDTDGTAYYIPAFTDDIAPAA